MYIFLYGIKQSRKACKVSSVKTESQFLVYCENNRSRDNYFGEAVGKNHWKKVVAISDFLMYLW